MSGKIRQLRQAGSSWEIGGAVAARVLEAQEGEARLVEVEGEPVAVTAHLSDVPLLKQGDGVLVCRTAAGAVLLGRLRSPGEPPRPRLETDVHGKLRVEAVGGICLQVGEARLEISPEGRIWVDGKEIYGLAAGRLRLQGALIELN